MRPAFLALLALASACSQPYGPENSWFHANERDVPEDYAGGTGVRPGDVPPDILMQDQFGDEVALHQFYGKTVQLVLMAQWCPPCQEEAPAIEAASVALAEQEVQIIEVMLDPSDEELGWDDCTEWAEEYEVTHPVLADLDGFFDQMLNGGFPTLPVLDPELRVIDPDNYPFSTDRLATYAEETQADFQ